MTSEAPQLLDLTKMMTAVDDTRPKLITSTNHAVRGDYLFYTSISFTLVLISTILSLLRYFNTSSWKISSLWLMDLLCTCFILLGTYISLNLPDLNLPPSFLNADNRIDTSTTESFEEVIEQDDKVRFYVGTCLIFTSISLVMTELLNSEIPKWSFSFILKNLTNNFCNFLACHILSVGLRKIVRRLKGYRQKLKELIELIELETRLNLN